MSTISIVPHRVAAPRPVRVAAQPRRQAGPVRLTRRGRLVVFLFALAVVVTAAVWLASGSAATREEGAGGSIDVVTVAPGETLWQIASDVAAATGGDVRGAIADIQDLNTLDGSTLYAGQQLRVPAAQ